MRDNTIHTVLVLYDILLSRFAIFDLLALADDVLGLIIKYGTCAKLTSLQIGVMKKMGY